MQRKSTTIVRDAVEAKDVTRALSKTRTLASEEEKVLRMRYGSKVVEKAPLTRHGEGNAELQDELLLMEMQLLRGMRQHQKQLAQRAAPQPSRAKDKIVRALRKRR